MTQEIDIGDPVGLRDAGPSGRDAAFAEERNHAGRRIGQEH